ncbi:ectonucleoside triphosphate diphosphohydrolase 2-like [Gigantopelta aegis]|uniref:ectonucleoside triphosphate diphosphohydrolase 2-like n=1 Tax=Gigantopelta aegis TaxID=1735272 RepID=UPI001B88B65A|nr:ectonucleoside triphosphate diphosphohydrolase 2-like [Gigantopelta aegis]XP_041371003.1 ectonucleoside triphosphate diphosphohydrolase 2-like [Gigantopelta aegis]
MEIEVIVESHLPSGSPQGTRRIHLPSDSSVEYLLNKLCTDSGIPFTSNYCLRNARNMVLDRKKTLHDSDVITGSVLRWTTESTMHKVVHCHFNTWCFMSVLAFFIGAAGLIAVGVIKSKENTHLFQFGIVFDAGSSHTSMYIYRWEGSKTNNTAIASQFTETVRPHFPGLASLTNDLQSVHDVITQCLDKAKERIPSQKYKDTPVYLGATAGMRLLHESNSSASKLVLKAVRDSISKYPFKFNQSLARIISGAEEGTFSWITGNYVMGVFHVTPPAKIIESTKKIKTFGALDLGGASTQITFVPRDMKMPANYSYDVKLYGHEHRVYSHSFLCYGVNEALRRLRAELVREQNYSSTIYNPCLPKGFNTTVWNHTDIFYSWCVSGFHAQQAFGSDIVPSEDVDKNVSYVFKGESNATKCQALVRKNLFNFKKCRFPSCSFNDQFQPPVNGNFYAFSSFYYVTSFLNLTDGTRQFSMEDFQKTLSSLCDKTWAEVEQMVAVQNQSKPYYCFQATFINILLTKGYKFNSTNWHTLKFVQKLAGTDVGWSLGFMLQESNGIPAKTVKVLISTLTFSLLLALFVIFILLAVGFAIHSRKQQRLERSQQYRKLPEYGSL